jgi:hypothetical protein
MEVDETPAELGLKDDHLALFTSEQVDKFKQFSKDP